MRAAQWSSCVEPPAPVWVEQWRTWLPELVARYAHVRLLNQRQRIALWEQIVADRSGSVSVLNLPAVAAWASDAWSILRRYEIEDAATYGDNSDLRTLLAWGATYEAHLLERGWADHQSVLAQLAETSVSRNLARQPRHLGLLDLEDMPALEIRSLRHLEALGYDVSQRRTPTLDGRVAVHSAESRAHELEWAMDWLAARLAGKPALRVALVAAHDNVLQAIVRRRSSEWPEIAFARGTCPMEMPAIAAAMNALELLGPDGGALHLSSWLRSPFMQSPDPAQAGASARFEIARRETLLSQFPLRRTQRGVLQSMTAIAPQAAQRLTRALERGERFGNVAPLADWAQLWRDQLSDLRWLATSRQSERENARSTIERAFDAVTALDAMLGAVNGGRALEELRSALSERLLGSPLPLAGLHVLEHIDDVGPGYAAVWVTGMSQVAWPPRPRQNPLLPRRLMRDLRVPWGSREDCFERAAHTTRRVAGAAAEVVFSHSPGDDETHARGSALLRAWPVEGAREPDEAESRHAGDAVVGDSADLEIVPEHLEALGDTDLHGGAALLDAQATCPLRAFIDYRLMARSPQPWPRGIPPVVRGKILHRSAALLLTPGIGTQQISDASIDWNSRIAQAAEQAVGRELGEARARLGALAAMEQARVRQALLHLLDAERSRADFVVEAVESRIRVDVDQYRLSARLDRLDRLHSGEFAVIDYKTGRSIARPYWFDEDFADYQLPLYVVAIGASVSAMALCSLAPDRSVYRGYWRAAGTFPGTATRRDETLEWDAQIDEWREEISALVRAFVAGDVAIYEPGRHLVSGLYAPLSRVAEADRSPEESEAT